MESEDDELIEQVGEQLDAADLVIILPMLANEDAVLTCLVCGLGNCEFSTMTIGATRRQTHGIHEKCAEPYLARKDEFGGSSLPS